MRINRIVPLLLAALLPGAGVAPTGAGPPPLTLLVVLLGGPLVAVAAMLSLLRRRRRRQAVATRGAEHGLSAPTAEFLGRFLAAMGPDAAEALLGEPAALRDRLADALREARDDGAATLLASQAATLLAELQPGPPAFPGAPRPFTALRLFDPTEARTPDVPAWLVSADERSLTLVSRAECPWPARRLLHVAAADDSRAAAIEVQLLLRPAYPTFQWVLTHRQVDIVTNRRASVRVPCRLPTFILPDGGDAPRLRERLLRDEPLDADTLRLSECWARRHEVTVLDLSADGARIALQHQVTPRQRCHLLLRQPDGALAAMPLAEVVSVTREEDGTVRAGTRFVNLRLRERMRVAEFVRGLERAAVTTPG